MLDVGKWKLPFYIGGANPDLTEDGAERLTRAPNLYIGVKIGYKDSAFMHVKVDKKKLEDRLNRQEDWLKRTGRLREYLPNEFEETVKQGRKTDQRMIEKSALIATLGTVLTLT